LRPTVINLFEEGGVAGDDAESSSPCPFVTATSTVVGADSNENASFIRGGVDVRVNESPE